MRIIRILALPILLLVNGSATAGIDETYNRSGPTIWSTDFYARLVGRNAFQKSIAVLVGVGNYDKFPSLSAPAADALRVRDFLRDEAGFDQIITLTDEKATYARIAELMETTIPNALGQNDRFLFYFSGHGVTRALATTKRGYLVLKNSGRGEWQNMIDMERMKQWTENVAQARHSLFLLDACFSGLAAYETKAGDVREKTLNRLMQPGHYIVTAGTEGEETYIYKGESLFTQAFLSAARGEDFAPNDGIVPLNEMMTRINRTLDAKQAEIGDQIRMTPRQYRARITNNAGEFFFLPKERPRNSVANTPVASRIEPKTGTDVVTAVPRLTDPLQQTAPQRANPAFEIRSGTEANGLQLGAGSYNGSIGECEQRCAETKNCSVFTYSRAARACYLYPKADFVSNQNFESGIRNLTSSSSQTAPKTAIPAFEIRGGTEANGLQLGAGYYNGSIGECEQRCAETKNCNVFTYSRAARACYLYPKAEFVSNRSFESGIRK
ncbi:PAN domain-containing protein [Bradyrhizobium sp. McL0615]|uniref:PAN domain-containing protein n=1 Tax=Bradyrhizobium sp. McL0615 TaxID=3415673 RepID=UPI003CF41111